MSHFVDFRNVWLAYNDELLAQGHFAVEDISLQVTQGEFIAIVGPSGAADNAIVRFDTTTGKLIQSSLASVDDNGMGDPLRFDAERLRILLERHLLHTGSPRARALLEDWETTLSRFVKVMPIDYKRALAEQKKEAAKV